MAKFEKGHKKVGGIQKGGVHKSREPIRQMYADFVLGNFEDYKKAMNKLLTEDPASYVRAFNDAVKHILPALQSIEMTTKDVSQASLAEKINNLALEAEPADEG